MATINKQPSGKWRAQVRIKGVYKTSTHDTKTQAKAWATNIESQINQSQSGKIVSKASLAKLIDLFVEKTVEKGRSRTQMLNTLKSGLGQKPTGN